MPNAQTLAIQLSLQNLNTVLNGINAITNAWTQQGRRVTQNQLALVALLNQEVQTMAAVSAAAMQMGNTTSQAMTGMQKGIVAFGISASNAVNHLAGGFSWLSSIIGGLGGLIGGSLVGGPAGGAIGTAIGQLGGSILGTFANIPVKIFEFYINAAKKAASSILDIFKGLFNGIKNVFFGPVSMISLLLGKGFSNIGEGLQETIQDIFDAAMAFQTLRISIETLTAREISRSSAMVDMGDMTDMVTEKTRNLFNWLTKVSLTSPFTMESITRSMKFASAMGLPIGAVQQLTLATGNFSAAMGLSEDHQERIMYNLAQIFQQGKLTGREFRDLAISFVPVYDIIKIMAKEANMTTEAFKKLALEGGIPVEDFFKHFIDYMSTNYPDAMKKMSRTMTGVRNNVTDFIQVVLGMEVLGPVMDKISGKLADVLDLLLSAKTHRLAQDFGLGLAHAFDLIAPEVNKLTTALGNMLGVLGFTKPTVEGVANAFAVLYLNIKYAIGFMASAVDVISNGIKNYVIPALQSMGLISKNGTNWGAALIKNFATGMIIGTARFLAQAIAYITAFIKGFFAPHSPPKVAPHIDDYGAQTINEWISGMKDANYGMIGKIVGGNVASQLAGIGGYPVYEPGGGVNVPETGGGAIQAPNEQGFINPNQTGQLVQNVIAQTKEATDQIVYFVTQAGIEAAAGFMHNFNEGMYEALDSTQSVVQNAFQALAGIGVLDKNAVPEMFYDFSLDMIEALDTFNETGKISNELIENMRNVGMGLGPELADLILKEFSLSKAIEDAARAQERLDAAILGLDQARGQVRMFIREYNALLRAGSNRNILKTKLAEVNAAEHSVTVATKEKYLAEENKKIADEQLAKMKEAVALQEKLTNNLIELIQAQAQAISGAGGGMEDITEEWGDILGQFTEDTTESLSSMLNWDDIDANHPEIKKSWEAMGKLFADTFNDTLFNADTTKGATGFVENLKNTIRDILGMTNPAPDLSNIIGQQNIGTVVGGGALGAIDRGQSFFQEIIDSIFSGRVDFSNAITRLTSVLVEIITRVASDFMKQLLDPTTVIHKLFWDLGIEIGKAILEGIDQGLMGELGIPDVTETTPGYQWNKPFLNLPNATTPTNVQVPTAINFNMETISWKDLSGMARSEWVLSGSPAEWIYQGKKVIDLPTNINVQPTITNPDILSQTGINITDTILTTAQKEVDTWGGTNNYGLYTQAMIDAQVKAAQAQFQTTGGVVTQTILDYANGLGTDTWFGNNDISASFAKGIDTQVNSDTSKTTFNGVGSDIAGSVAEGVSQQTSQQTVGQSIMDLFNGAIEWLRNILPWHSPIPMFMDVGNAISESVADGITGNSKNVNDALQELLRMSNLPVMLPAQMGIAKYMNAMKTRMRQRVSSPSVNRITNVKFGDVFLQNGMDMATLKETIRKVILE